MTQVTKPIVVDARDGYLLITLPAYESPEQKKAADIRDVRCG